MTAPVRSDLPPPEALAGPPALYRSMTLERLARAATQAPGDDRIPVALSSETPVERYDWWEGERYWEILDHGPDAVDLSYARDGMPFLVSHDTRIQVGILEDVVVKDRKLHGMLRTSRSQQGTEIRQDIEDGIRKKVSVAYVIRRQVLERDDEEEGKTYRVTRWMPMEGSTVPIPADYTVGVYRSADGAARSMRLVPGTERPLQAKENPMAKTTDQPDAAAPTGTVSTPTPAAGVGSPTSESVRGDAAWILETCQQHGFAERAAEFIREGVSRDQVSRILLAEIRKRDIDTHVPVPPVQLTETERKRYSFARALLAGDPESKGIDAGFEREISAELARKLPTGMKYRGGLLIPTITSAQSQEIQTRAGLDSKTTGSGLELKFTEPGDFIELLRNRVKLLALGARRLSGLTGPVSFPRQSGAGTATWIAENPGSDTADSFLTLNTVTLAFKTLMSTTYFSRQLLFSALSASVDAELMVRDDLAKVLGLAIDLAGINGGGGSAPTGILGTSGIGDVAGGTNGAAPTWAHVVELETDVADANADIGTMAYLSNAIVRGKLKQTLKNTVAGAEYIWGGSQTAPGIGELNGYPAHVSNQVPKNLTKGTSTTIASAIIFGVFSELILGEWGVLEVLVDPYAKKKQAMIEVTAFHNVDWAVRHPASFSAMKDALTS